MSLKPTTLLALMAGLSTLPLTPPAAFAWGSSGHRIVAQVGEDHLSDGAKAAMREIAGSRSLAMIATWPDFIRSEPEWDCAKPWHFLTVEDGQELAVALQRQGQTGPDCKRLGADLGLPDNVVEAIGYFGKILRRDEAATDSFQQLLEARGVTAYGSSIRLTALSFLVHFVGDVHQPLHVGRGGDHGGNNVSVNWFGEIENLHSVWDEGLIESEGLSFTEFVDFLEGELAGEVAPDHGSGPLDWARESLAYRHRVYEIWNRTSRSNYLPELKYGYAHDHIGIIKRRLYQGGLRLAALLDPILQAAPE